MKGLFIPEITAEMFRNGCLEGIEALMAEGEIYDIDYTGWIPVSERLPDTSEQVLVTVLWREPYVHCEVTLGEYWDNGEAWGDWKDGEIIAWMPLPEPYKGGDAE